MNNIYNIIILVILMEEKIISVIDELRPFLMNDGGNITFIKLEDNIVYISLQGACVYCGMQDFTVKDGIEKIIKEKVPEIKEVRVVKEVIEDYYF